MNVGMMLAQFHRALSSLKFEHSMTLDQDSGTTNSMILPVAHVSFRPHLLAGGLETRIRARRG